MSGRKSAAAGRKTAKTPEPKRPSAEEYFWQITNLVASRSTCLRRQVGAIIVLDKRILATGYNGSPRNMRHCHEVGCIRALNNIPSGERQEYCRGVHAEQNAILQAAYIGFSIKDATLYCTVSPCVVCAKLIINVGIKEVVYGKDYSDELARGMLREAGVKLRKIKV